MLTKLIKYDLKYIYKQLFIFYLIVLVSALVARLTASSTDHFIIKFIHEFAQGCTLGFGFGMFINAAMRTWARLRLNLYGNESYLTHTLPVKRSTLWAAKFLSSIIVIATSCIVILVAILILIFSSDFISTWGLDDPSMRVFYLVFLLGAFFQVIYIVQSGLTGITIGHLHNNNRIPLSVIYGLVAYFCGSVILFLVTFIWSCFNPDLHQLIFNGTMFDIQAFNQLLLGFTFTYAAEIAITYLINYKILTRGVNVD